MGKLRLIMRKYSFILALSLLASGCSTSTYQQGAGTMTGAMIGSSIGSLLGGIVDGSRGDWWGTAVGTIAGAAIGNAINSSKKVSHSTQYNVDDQASVDISFQPDGYTSQPQEDGQVNLMAQLDVRNIKFVDENHDLKLNPQEHCKLIFEIYNVGPERVSGVTPIVTVNSQKKHIFMSQPVRIDGIDSGEGLRYTVSIYSDKGLKTGTVGFSISFLSDGQKPQVVRTFDLPCENNKN